MATKRLFQLVVAREDQGGIVAAGIDTPLGSNATLLVSDPVVTYDRATFDRQINRVSLTPLTPLEGVVEASCTFRVEMSGTSAGVGNPPAWGVLLEACGLQQNRLSRVSIGALGVANAFYSEETVTTDASGAGTARVMHDTWDGSTYLYHVDDTGIAIGGGGATITGGTSGATAVLGGASELAGYSWSPKTRPIVELNIETLSGGSITAGALYIGATSGAVLQAIDTITSSSGANPTFFLIDPGDFLSAGEGLNDVNGAQVAELGSGGSFIAQNDIPAISLAVIEDGTVRALKGCRGSVTFSANIGEPMFMDFSFKGLISSISDGTLSGSPAVTALVPPSFLEISYGVANDSPVVAPADEHTACVTSWSFELANEVSLEKCAASTDGTRGSALITGRAATGSIDPSVRPEAQFPWLSSYRNGTTFRQRITLGDSAANQFHISLPACQITSEGAGDRDGIATRDIAYQASGKSEDGTDREDREFILTYHQDTAFTR